ncbi:alpha/beta hydrolase [Ruania alkalisoli]|uniref:Alpha/beta hydrolase n=1 Tax=Ruania alkalisoli TaxID=2779775 RepID=A0A7M1SPQ5_9MICO|nr:alpha/beta hydrolase [Ruania alkalisoli]QOR69546.1 alpha/beta hydrolase [Ruania alkalisoli]
MVKSPTPADTDRPHALLIPGAGSDPGYWDALRARLTASGRSSTAVDLPCADESASLEDYARTVVDAAERDGAAGEPVHVVAHSFGAFTAGLVPDLLPVARLTLLSPMIPAPGESGAQWWAATDQAGAHQRAAERDGLQLPLDMDELFYTGFSAEQRENADRWERDQSDRAFSQPWPRAGWPEVPTTVLAFASDRLFPPEFTERLATERIGPHIFGEVPGGHMGMVSHPDELADAITRA